MDEITKCDRINIKTDAIMGSHIDLDSMTVYLDSEKEIVLCTANESLTVKRSEIDALIKALELSK